jgi:hypothetical protein
VKPAELVGKVNCAIVELQNQRHVQVAWRAATHKRLSLPASALLVTIALVGLNQTHQQTVLPETFVQKGRIVRKDHDFQQFVQLEPFRTQRKLCRTLCAVIVRQARTVRTVSLQLIVMLATTVLGSNTLEVL